MITGLIAPDEGGVTLDGQDITALPMYQRARLGVGYLPQEASIFRGLTVEHNIRAVLEVVEPKRKRREATLEELLERVLDRPPPPHAGAGAVGRRAAAGRDRPGAGVAARISSCSTSPSPASTRSRSATSATWWSTSRIAASAS